MYTRLETPPVSANCVKKCKCFAVLFKILCDKEILICQQSDSFLQACLILANLKFSLRERFKFQRDIMESIIYGGKQYFHLIII